MTTSKASAGSPPWAAGSVRGPMRLEELEHRAGPAVRQEEGMGVRTLTADVPVVDVDAVDLAEELGPGVERGLLGAPVVLVAPVVAEFAHVLGIGAVVPAGVGDGVGPAGAIEAVAKVVEDAVGDGDAEGSWGHGGTIGKAIGCWPLAVGAGGGWGKSGVVLLWSPHARERPEHHFGHPCDGWGGRSGARGISIVKCRLPGLPSTHCLPPHLSPHR